MRAILALDGLMLNHLFQLIFLKKLLLLMFWSVNRFVWKEYSIIKKIILIVSTITLTLLMLVFSFISMLSIILHFQVMDHSSEWSITWKCCRIIESTEMNGKISMKKSVKKKKSVWKRLKRIIYVSNSANNTFLWPGGITSPQTTPKYRQNVFIAIHKQ